MVAQRKQITVKGKKYGYQEFPGHVLQIRSEDNPAKTPYLKVGGKRYNEVIDAIAKAKGGIV